MPEINDYNDQTVTFRENKGRNRAYSPLGSKVGQDIVFTKRQQSTITPSYDQHVFWFLSAITVSFFIAQSLLILFGR